MIQVVYVSAAVSPFSADALKALLAKARIRNATYGVTGMLLYHSGSFLQVLEGHEADVNLIFSSILRDPRHAGTKVLHRQTIEYREFPDWSMGFYNTSRWPQEAPGLIDYRLALLKLSSAPSAAKHYLRLFQQGLCRQVVSK
jgi:hypothetical protein